MLLIFSLVFYAWGEPVYVLLMLISIFINYSFALLIDKFRSTKPKLKKLFLAVAVAANLLILGYYKYSGFLISNINKLAGLDLPVPEIALPIGISFFTFQAMSYVIDVYRQSAGVQKNPLNVALYISLFPQLIAGPIVRYETVALELKERRESLELFTAGAKRFVAGLAKKVLLANSFAVIADSAFSGSYELSVGMAWLGAISYSLQIYFDFSGYSDMAIGLGKMFGFNFLENFNYPYISKSITDFWRRWHISLSSWFRDYVYIPLGGNRKGLARQVLNLAVVWFLTGLWHGAGWTFISWGVFYFILLMLEKAFLLKLIDRVPVINRIYALAAIIIGWVIFRAPDMHTAFGYIGTMFGGNGAALSDVNFSFYFMQNLALIIIGAAASLPFAKMLLERTKNAVLSSGSKFVRIAAPVVFDAGFVLLFAVCAASLASNAYNPFIYFNF